MAELKISDDLQKVIKKIILDTYYPIGKLYLSVGNEDPNQTIGGTWTKLSGYYLYADTSINNTTYTGKHTQSHTLTIDQIPSHGHSFRGVNDGASVTSRIGAYPIRIYQDRLANWPAPGSTDGISNTGGGQGHNHNIATKGIYVWQRTA